MRTAQANLGRHFTHKHYAQFSQSAAHLFKEECMRLNNVKLIASIYLTRRTHKHLFYLKGAVWLKIPFLP